MPFLPVARTIPVGGPSDFLGVGHGSLWVPASKDGTVVRIDLGTGEVVARIRTEEPHSANTVSPFGVAVDESPGGLVWVTKRSEPYAVVGIDSETNEVAERIELAGQPYAALPAAGFVWVSLRESGSVLRVDPSDPTSAAPIEIGRPTGLASDGVRVWVVDTSRNQLIAIDPTSLAIEEISEVGADTQGIAITDDAIWTANGGDGTVSRVAIETGAVSPIDVAGGTWAVSARDGDVWAGSYDAHTIVRLDPISGQVTASIDVGGQVNGIAIGGGAVWASTWSTDTLTRFDLSSLP